MFPSSQLDNPLSYPAGRLPGFDPSHPLARGNVRLSAIAFNGTVLNLSPLAPGKVFSPQGSANMTTDGNVGPVFNSAAAGAAAILNFSSSFAPPVASTQAAIFIPNVTTGGATIQMMWSTGNDGIGISHGSSLLTYQLAFSVAISSGISVPTGNTPYFAAASCNATTVNFVLLNLSTGQLQTATAAGNTPVATNPTQFLIGSYGSGYLNPGGGFARGMLSDSFHAMPDLVAAAADPWSFWHPR